MKYKSLFLLFTILSLANFGFSQETKSKFQFDVLDDNGNFIKDLKTSDVQVSGIKDLSVNLLSDRTLEIMVMIDASASQEKMIPFEKKAAQTFVSDFLKPEKDKIAIVSFTGEVRLVQDLTNDFQKAKEQIEKIKFIPPSGYIGGGIVVGQPPPINKKQALSGSTSIWDSLKQVLEAFSKIQDNGSQRAVILISDGVNTFGETKLKEAIEFSIKTRIPVYAIGIGDDYYEGVDKKTLKKITEETGGISVIPKKKLEDFSQLLNVIEQSLRSDYELTFAQNSSIPKDKLQEIKIEIVNPELRKQKLQIIQPKGFFAPN
jgi:VWFA-related protein